MAPDDIAAAHRALEAEVRQLFRRAWSSAQATARRVHPDLDASAYPLLAHIAANPGVRGSEIATHFGIGRATVSRQLSRLYKLDLVTRTIDPDDSRGQLLTLTETGRRRLAAARDARIAMSEQALADWRREDVVTLATLLGRFSDDLQQWNEQHRSV